MNDYYKQVRKLFEKHECVLKRQGKGSHEIWYSPITKRSVTLSSPCRKRHTANNQLKQAGIDKKL